MIREEQTIQAAKDFLPHITNAQLTLFAAGAMWADEHPKEGLWDKEKVCKYLKKILETSDANYNENYIRSFQFNNVDELIEDLIKTYKEK